MIDYNDGKWHKWRGGECPVHLKSAVEVILLNGRLCGADKAGVFDFPHDGSYNDIISFRVITPYIEQPPEPAKLVNRDLRTIGGRIEMTKPHMTLPNGDIIYDGEYGITSDGLMVGPMNIPPSSKFWIPEICADFDNRGWYDAGKYSGTDGDRNNIIAKWHPIESVKRRTIYVINGMTFETARAAKTAYPGCEPVKFKEYRK